MSSVGEGSITTWLHLQLFRPQCNPVRLDSNDLPHALGSPLASIMCTSFEDGEGPESTGRTCKRDKREQVRPTEWRRRMGVEPTRDSDYCPVDGVVEPTANKILATSVS